jgi:hypothetical protein
MNNCSLNNSAIDATAGMINNDMQQACSPLANVDQYANMQGWCQKIISELNLVISTTKKSDYYLCTELERPPERRDHQSHKVTRLTSSRPRMAQSYTNAN